MLECRIGQILIHKYYYQQKCIPSIDDASADSLGSSTRQVRFCQLGSSQGYGKNRELFGAYFLCGGCHLNLAMLQLILCFENQTPRCSQPR